MDRRDFLLSTGIILASASAYSFGNSIEPLIDDKSEKLHWFTAADMVQQKIPQSG